jgi:hypothetical protein
MEKEEELEGAEGVKWDKKIRNRWYYLLLRPRD